MKKTLLPTLIALVFTEFAGAQTTGLQSFEVSEGYTNATALQNLSNSRWTIYTGSAGAYSYSQAGVIDRNGIASSSQLLDIWSAGDFEYDFNAADLGAAPASLSNSQVKFSIWFCPNTNGAADFDFSPYHNMAFYDGSGTQILGLGTGNETAIANELKIYKSLAGSSYNVVDELTANSHAWNRWDVTFSLSEKGTDKVSVDFVRDYGLAPGVAQSEDAAVTIYDNVDLGTNVDYLASWRITSNGSSNKYYYDNVSIHLVPEPSSALLLGLGGIGLLIRRKR